jgi:cytidylate kinase
MSEKIDIEQLLEYIHEGLTYRQMAVKFGVKLSTLADFTARNEHSARVRAALQLSADTYADKAEQVLIDSKGTKEELMRARELSQYYKWKASKRCPKTYGEKLDVDHTSKGERIIPTINILPKSE